MRGSFKRVILEIALAAFGTACSGSMSGGVVTQCLLPTDQNTTLTGHWQTTPVPIAISSTSGFSQTEISAITAAADTWNSFYGASKGMSSIDYGGSSPRMSSAPKPSTICGGSEIVQNGQYTGPAVIYKDTTWPYTSQYPNVIALTTTCPGSSGTQTPYPLKYFNMAIIELNYQNFFTSGNKIPDLQSIITHELGHLMGLAHSCEQNPQSSGMPNCSEPNLDPDYVAASLYPIFGFDNNGNGQQKRSLQSNDEGRANCLYQGANPTSSPTP